MPPEFFAAHWIATTLVGTFCLWISICFILQVWIIHHKVSFIRKLFWSLMLLLPGLGWLVYGALFENPTFNGTAYGGVCSYGGGDGSYDGGGHGGGHGGHGDGGGHH